jgi:hypothetical protein
VTEEKPVPVTPLPLEKPWRQTKEVLTPVLTGGALTSVGTFFAQFGSIPTENLIVLVVAGIAVTVGTLLYLRHRERCRPRQSRSELRDVLNSAHHRGTRRARHPRRRLPGSTSRAVTTFVNP